MTVVGDSTHLVDAKLRITSDPVIIDLDKKWPAHSELKFYKDVGTYTASNSMPLGSLAFVSCGNFREWFASPAGQ
jgi:hypothetical protein